MNQIYLQAKVSQLENKVLHEIFSLMKPNNAKITSNYCDQFNYSNRSATLVKSNDNVNKIEL
jgi:hypothetical protein